MHRFHSSIFSAVDAATGRTLWQSRELKNCVVTMSGDYVQERGQLAIAKLSPQGIDVRWRLQALSPRCWVGPAIADGLVLIRDLRKLIAFELP